MNVGIMTQIILDIILKKGYTMNRKGELFRPDGQQIKGSIDQYGYRKVTLRGSNGKSYPVKFHRIQAFIKFGCYCFEKGIVVRHLDGNPLNNNYDNIEIGNNSQNQMDIPVEKRRKMSSHPKYNHEGIIDDYEKGLSYTELMNKYSVKNKSTIHNIVNYSLAAETRKLNC